MQVFKTAEQVKKDILLAIPQKYAKTEGNLAHDIPSSVAIEIGNLYKVAKGMFDLINVENLEDEELDRFIEQRKGLKRKRATFAIGVLNVTGVGTINTGSLFETETGLQFRATETKTINGTGTIKIACLKSGTIGNVGAESIIYMPVTITGITAVTNLEATYDGFEAETNEAYRARYYEALQTPPTSGNKFHYLVWAKEVTGVGGAKVFPLWAGDNTVKVVIINADMQPASSEIINATQTYIDPESNGRGEGQAPIGAYCTVVSADPLSIDIEVDVTEIDGYTLEEVTANITANIVDYLKNEVAFKQNYVSYAKIGSIIFNTEGVKDYTMLLVNGGNVNIDIEDTEVAVIGTVIID